MKTVVTGSIVIKRMDAGRSAELSVMLIGEMALFPVVVVVVVVVVMMSGVEEKLPGFVDVFSELVNDVRRVV